MVAAVSLSGRLTLPVPLTNREDLFIIFFSPHNGVRSTCGSEWYYKMTLGHDLVCEFTEVTLHA